MKLKIVQAGEPVLRQRARPLSKKEITGSAIQQLIEWMRETMYDAPGVGLAAPQVGLPLQIAVIEDRAAYLKSIPPERLEERRRRPVPFQVLINPQVTTSGGLADFFEGCLSIAGWGALVPAIPGGPGGVPGPSRESEELPCRGLARPDRAARGGSPARKSLHRQDAHPNIHRATTIWPATGRELSAKEVVDEGGENLERELSGREPVSAKPRTLASVARSFCLKAAASSSDCRYCTMLPWLCCCSAK